jgi:hypothetical protein
MCPPISSCSECKITRHGQSVNVITYDKKDSTNPRVRSDKYSKNRVTCLVRRGLHVGEHLPGTLSKWGSIEQNWGLRITGDQFDPRIERVGELFTCKEIAKDVCSGGGASDTGVPVALSARYDTRLVYLSMYAFKVSS